MSTIKGRCHCGQTEFTVKMEAPSHILCHCDACKIINGSDYTLNQIVPKEDFELTKGTLGTYTYTGDSGNPVHCYYCSNCTTHIYHHQTVAGPKYVIRTAGLEGFKDWPVAAEIYAKNTIKWQPAVAAADKVFQLTPPS
ncbi:hypothetical protein GX51_02487 [Blastomyces parvus]|uniref:CENP-V/GFA domain-containing protein n=1 Tax=Blastomyces parvus TaxID=2060905 RepID=A0A2B7XBN1_9EURO|nr:hypothetical protein GX51_02487 [Blastomyces parvus]